MVQSYLRNPGIERLPTILEELHTGSLSIPPFQRDFEWTGEQRLALCGSVRLGLPTGSLMVWRTSRVLAAEDPIGPYSPVRPVSSASPAPQYLLDGRQRMTTLYAALAAAFWTREGKEAPKPAPSAATPPDGTPWSIMFDLAAQEFVFEPLVNSRSDKHPTLPLTGLTNRVDTKSVLLPLSVLLDDTAYDEWRNRNSITRELTNRARALRSAFLDYQIPVVPLATDDIGVVTLTFKRINNGGTPMSDADMARALAWSESFDLRNHLDSVRETLNPAGWGDVDDDALLKIVAAVSQLDPTEVDPEKLAEKIKLQPEVVSLAGERIIGATALLAKRLGIYGPGSLPYTQILVFAARALHQVGGHLNPDQEAQLAAWVAEVCIDERFGGAPTHMIKADWRAFAHRLGLPNADPPRPRDEKRPFAKECWRFSMGWARSRVTALVLATQEPRSADDRAIPEPFALVARGSESMGMLIAEGGLGVPLTLLKSIVKEKRLGGALRSPANRVACPPEQLPRLREVLFTRDCPETILRSHLIDEGAHAELVAGNLDKFFEMRRMAILGAEKRWVESHGGQVDLAAEPRTYAQG